MPVAAVAVNVNESEPPGGIPAPVPTKNTDTVHDAAVAEKVALGRKDPGVAAVTVHPLGTLITNPVMVNWLLLGFATFNPIVLGVPPRTGFPLVTVTVGKEAFDAKTGVATGMSTSRPENARSARVSPELNFVTYSFRRVFMYVFDSPSLNGYLRGVDNLSIFRVKRARERLLFRN